MKPANFFIRRDRIPYGSSGALDKKPMPWVELGISLGKKGCLPALTSVEQAQKKRKKYCFPAVVKLHFSHGALSCERAG